MSVILTRVDGRLLHGQVLVGWRTALGFDAVGIADERVAANSMELDIIAMAEPGLAVEARTPGDAVSWYDDGPQKRIVLLRSPAALAELVAAGAAVEEANIGGVYPRAGARRFLDYVYVTPEDIDALRRVDAAGVRLSARDLPTRPAVDLNLALAEGRLEFDNLPVGSA